MNAALQYRIQKELKAAILLRAKRLRVEPGDLIRVTLAKEFSPEMDAIDAAAIVASQAQPAPHAMQLEAV